MNKSKKSDKKISIVVPAYNCKEAIAKTVLELDAELSQISRDYEILVIIDGKDYEIFELVNNIKNYHIRIYHYEMNRGKGFAVKLGLEESTGDLLGFIDGGGDIHPSALKEAYEILSSGEVKIVCGSKVHPESNVLNYSYIRKIFTFVYNRLVRILLGIDYKDTQTGLKLFTRDMVEDVLPKLVINKFAFDAELLAVADLYGYKKHIDVPIKIMFKGKSNAATLKSIIMMFVDTLNIAYRMRVRRYYNTRALSKKNYRELFNITFL